MRAGLAPRVATYEDVLAAPPHVVAELVAGELHTSPRPASTHAAATSALSGELYGPFRRGKGGPGGWVILVEPELHLAEDVLVPDLAGWRRERMPEIPDAPFFALAPDWACEVASPSTRRLDRGPKMDAYARSGVPFVWLVEPLDQLLEVYTLEGGRYVRLAAFTGCNMARIVPFDAVELDLGALYAR
jgi:Uma2 family endonuclease